MRNRKGKKSDKRFKQGDQMSLLNNRPICSPTHVLSKLIHTYIHTFGKK
jgi:hypothetical protein